MYILLIFIIIVLGVFCIAAGKFLYAGKRHLKSFSNWAIKTIRDLENEANTYKSKCKSTEVRTGQIMEKMAPFSNIFKYEPRNAYFLGNFIDYVVFSEDEIVFVEVKTGKSSLSKKQRNIKKLVEEGKVRFELVRFDND